MPTKYSDIIMYLDAIAANANGDLGTSPHHYWWHIGQNGSQPSLAYNDFKTGTVYGTGGVPIIGTDSKQKDPLQSMFYLLLTTPGGHGGYHQMPWKGPYITDPGFSVQLANGVNISGQQIMANLKGWLGNGYPE